MADGRYPRSSLRVIMRAMQPPRLILASRSPRRAELLSRLGLDYTVSVPEVDESVLPGEAPAEAARRLASLKASAALEEGALSIGCDTLVVHLDQILGKPMDEDEAEDEDEEFEDEE